jgi:SulP family sulfate permease
MTPTAALAVAQRGAPTTRAYGKDALRKDLLAGMTVAAISLPQAMAYALIAGVDPRFGLYSAIVVTAIASAFGASSHLINGPTNAISLVVLSALAFFDPEAKIEAYQAMFLLGIMVGAIQIGIAVLKLGDLTRYISEAVVVGFMAGAGFLVALGQVANLLGVADQGTGHQTVVTRTWLTLTHHAQVNARAVLIGAGTILLVVVARRILVKLRLPRIDMLAALILAATVSALLGWSRPGASGGTLVAVLGRVPAGLPSFHVPEIQFAWVRDLGGSAVAIALLGLLEAIAIAKSIANESRQSIDYNRQCLAEGLANLGGGFFQCLPGSGSLTRSAINFQAGAVSRVSGLAAAATVALVVATLAPLARFVPKPALAGLLIVTAVRLVDRRRLVYALRASRFDAALVIATALTAVFVGVEYSILIGVALSVVMFVPRAARLQATELTVAPDRVIRGRQPDDPPCRHLVVYDLEGELFFGAAPELDRYLDELRDRAQASGTRVVILRLRRTRHPDLVCLERLEHFLRDLEAHGVVVLLSGVGADIAKTMKNLRFDRWLPADRVFLREPDAPGSSTIAAVRHAYRLLADDVGGCPHCARIRPAEGEIYYMV